VLDRTRHRAHGRVEIRTLKAVTVRGLGFPRASQVLQVTRRTRVLRSRRWRTVVVSAVTSLAHARASPARLADLVGGHWSVENGLHWVRDVTFTEDASQVRSGTARRSWPACATWPLACRAGQARSTSPPHSGSTAATPTDPWRPSRSGSDQTDITQERQSPGRRHVALALALQQPPRLLLIPGVVGQRLRDRLPHLVSERLILRLRGCCSSRHPLLPGEPRGRLGH
jgi:hypothetical protein